MDQQCKRKMISIDAGQNEKGSCDKMQKQLVVSALFGK